MSDEMILVLDVLCFGMEFRIMGQEHGPIVVTKHWHNLNDSVEITAQISKPDGSCRRLGSSHILCFSRGECDALLFSAGPGAIA